MKKTVIGFISLVGLGLLLGFGSVKQNGADDPCGGCLGHPPGPAWCQHPDDLSRFVRPGGSW